jgi:predicted N-acyltransferase
LVHEGFRSAVRRALEHEREGMDAYAEELLDHSPYAER